MNLFKTDFSILNIFSKEIIFLYQNDSIIKALEVLHENKISTLPILDKESGDLFGLFYLKDIIFLFNNDEKFTVYLNILNF